MPGLAVACDYLNPQHSFFEDEMKTHSVRNAMIAAGLMLASAGPALAQFSMNFDVSGSSIGINLSSYPQLQPIPGYPVYYAPGVNSNYFFYDGLYWVYDGQNWYASSWYNGPWSLVDPYDVPAFVLRVPVRYYRAPPAFFHGWRSTDAPHWGDHWGQSWSSRRTGWDHWNHNSAPAPAPLPTYQRQYTGSRYPQQTSQQASLESRNYRYQPHDHVAQQHFQEARTHAQTAPQQQPQQQARPQPQHTAPASRDQQAREQAQREQLAREQQAARPLPQRTAQPQPQQAPRPPQAQAPQERERPERTSEPNHDQTNQRNNERNQSNNGQGG
jgi:hypothetical protein